MGWSVASPAVGAEPGVVLRELPPEREVLDSGKPRRKHISRSAFHQPVPDPLAGASRASYWRCRQRSGQSVAEIRGIVLVIGMEHHHHIGPILQGLEVAGLLVPAVATILDVDDSPQAQLAEIVTVHQRSRRHKDHPIDHARRDIVVGALERRAAL